MSRNIRELAKSVVQKLKGHKLTVQGTEPIVAATLDALLDQLVRKKRIELRNRFVIDTSKRAARTARNPKTDEPVSVPERAAIRIRLNDAWQDKLSRAVCEGWVPPDEPEPELELRPTLPTPAKPVERPVSPFAPKLSTEDVRQIRERAGRGDDQRVLASDYGTSVTCINNVVNRRTYAHVA